MVQPIDRAAFLAALQATAQVQLQGVTLPGVGACYKRGLTAGDVLDASEAIDALVKAGLPESSKVRAAVSLAQTLCDESGHPLLNPQDAEHIRLLIAQPWSVLKGILGTDQPAAAEGDSPNA